jgi:hypothetical protein
MPSIKYFHEILGGPPRPVSCSQNPLTILGLRAVCQRALRWKVLIMFKHSLHLPSFSAMVPLYDTSFPISVERCTRTTLSTCFVPYRSLGKGNRQRSTPCFLLKSASLSLSLHNFVFGAPLSVVPKALLPSWVIESTIVCSADGLSSCAISTAR